MYKCKACGTAYLDPRPTASSIHLAYSSYYTHSSGISTGNTSLLKRLWLSSAKSYRNWRFSSHKSLRCLPGFLLVSLLPGKRRLIDAQMRHLPRPRSGQLLLDVGCGNGDFLRLATQHGWQCTGIDFDRRAVKAARADGLDVKLGGIEVFTGQERLFDVITLSHVIEHVHNPKQLLESCYLLLKENGTIWIETPNIDSQGHDLFNAYWRGLECPRHLMIFSRPALIEMLRSLNFHNVRDADYRPLCKIVMQESEEVTLTHKKSTLNLWERLEKSFNYWKLEQKAKKTAGVRELITLVAIKP